MTNPDPSRFGWPVLPLERCPGCRRRLDPVTRQEWADGEDDLVYFLCDPCFRRAENDPAFARIVDERGRDWRAMDKLMQEFRRGD